MRYEESTFAWSLDDTPVDVGELTRVRLGVDNGIATVTLDRPERLNAIDGPMLAELTRIFHHCDRNDDVRAVVLTGAGSTFSAGSEMTDDGFGGETAPQTEELQWLSPFQMRKPVIAAMNGHAVGAGLTLALQCDMRLVAQDAILSLPFVRLGVIAEWMGHWTLVRHLGVARASELLLTGRRFSGEEAAEWGLVNYTLPADEVLDASLTIAGDVVKHAAPVSVAVSKRLVWTALQTDQAQAGATERRLLESVLQHPDAGEGVEAFLAKRSPRWQGRVSVDLPEWL
ncbi:enoyl-CoA hydratase-related protein [Aeromicrobium panaciterrae]|uniref:enoyl-CoA hydratase/isomerase family protein n=1 Tax=Aeromicrobium panaciterrae TaxID=363861 RepID=UPI0031E15AD5